MSDPNDVHRLRQERDLYRSLLEIAHTDKIEPLLEEALALAVRATGAQRGHVHVFGEDGEDAWTIRHNDAGPESTPETMNSRSIEAEVLRKGRPVRSTSARLDPRFLSNDSVQGIEAVMCAPLGTGAPIGVLYLYGGARGRFFDENDERLAEVLARHLGPSIRALVDKARLRKRNDPTAPWRARLKLDRFVGQSEALADVFAQIAAVAPLDVGVLLTGASGTGKSAIARAIHESSRRQAAPFVQLNCAALPEHLVENELFGAQQGAHSMAHTDRPGKVAAAEGGTLFLDEIGELPLTSQAKLLSLLDNKTYYRLGDSEPIVANIRIVAATNADLNAMVEARQFREDLFFRLSIVPVRVPSLEERQEDIDLLSIHFRDAAAQRNNLPKLPLSPNAMVAVRTRSWPGNIRELSAKIEAGLIRASGRGDAQIEAHHLFDDAPKTVEGEFLTYQEATRRCQATVVREALKRSNNNVAEAARLLDVTRAHVYNLIKTLGLRDPEL